MVILRWNVRFKSLARLSPLGCFLVLKVSLQSRLVPSGMDLLRRCLSRGMVRSSSFYHLGVRQACSLIAGELDFDLAT